ncbi:MAG: hypothetical protein ACPG8W_19470 [Candidatus Promineifilaceae bacterium]
MTSRFIHPNNQRAAAAIPAAEATDTPESRALRSAPNSFNYRVINRGSKVGIHSMKPSVMLENIRALKNRGGRFPVVKAVNDMDWLIDVKAIDPNIVTIGRFSFNVDGIGEGLNGIHEVRNDDFTKYINTMFTPLEEKLRLRPELRQAVDYWEICNEPDPPGASGYRNLSLAMVGAIDRANAMGLKLAIFALNAGTPEWYEMEAMVATGVFAKAKAGGHIMTMHEGVFRDPTHGWINPIDHWYGDPIPANESATRWVQMRANGLFFFDHQDGAAPRPSWWANGTAGPLCFRYRYLYELLKQRNEVIPLVISEIVYGEGYGERGNNVTDMVNRVGWYDRKAAEDYYVWAHLPFTFGGGGEWTNRNYDFAIGGVVNYNAAQKDRPNANAPTGGGTNPTPVPTSPPATSTPVTPTPVPPTSVPPTPVATVPPNTPFKVFMPILMQAPPPTPVTNLPEVDRAIRVNLLPKNATLNERLYVISQTDAKKENIVQSAIDARDLATIGNNQSVVKSWASERWATSIVDFMNQQGIRTEQHVIPNQEATWKISPWEDAHSIVVNLMPQDTTFAEKSEVAAAIHSRREAMMQAEQDAVDFVKIGPTGSKLVVWGPERWSGDILAWLNERGVRYEIRSFGARRSNRVFID